MERRAAGALLALAACVACSVAAPTASNHTALDLYEGAPEGCYYNFQHYGEGDRIMTNEPCLNCTCHNRMLMCYLRVCPFTKPIGQDCTVEKRADQCCPIVTCPDVPVDLLTSTSTTSPAEYGATGLGKLDKYGCSIQGKYFPEGSKVPPTPNKPCEHCYCIRNMTTCVMQECTLHVDGCTPIYHKDVCCPVRYSCDHPEDEMPLLDDMSTTVRPTPGFLLTTTTMSPVTQMTQDCVHNDQIIADGASITTEKACEHCYCMKGDIVCVVQECGAPMENEGKNCTSLPPREGQCCPDTYICEGDELSTENIPEATTEPLLEALTTLSPPRRGGVEGSGYRNEANEPYTEIPTVEPELEGSGEEDVHVPASPETPEHEEITPSLEEGEQYIPVTTKAPSGEGPETATKENIIPVDNEDKETMEPPTYTTPQEPMTDGEKETTEVSEDEHLKPYDHVTIIDSSATESIVKVTTESSESLNTVQDISEHEEPQYIPSTTQGPDTERETATQKNEADATPDKSQDVTLSPEVPLEHMEPEFLTPSGETLEDFIKGSTDTPMITSDVTETETSEPEIYDSGTTGAPIVVDTETETDDSTKSQEKPITTDIPVEEKLTTIPDHAQNTVIVAEEESQYPHIPSSEDTEKVISPDSESTSTEKATVDDTLESHIPPVDQKETSDHHVPSSDDADKIIFPDSDIYYHRTSTEKATKDETAESQEHIPTPSSTLQESELTTAEPDKGLNTIPSETDEETTASLDSRRTTSATEFKPTEPTIAVETMEPEDVDMKTSVASESSTPLSDGHITKGDQYTITTEPSFRREDEASASTEKPKEELGSTTIKDEFVDEGLIPTSDKETTGADVPVDEEITTAMPDYNRESEEPVESKPPATESDLTASSEGSPQLVEETTSEQEIGLVSSTEKSVDVTIFTPDAQEEPSRIPGEGDCLLNGVTYRNNTVVPSSNNCHTGCRCVSSIVKCDPIICSPPPDYMSNCRSIYDTPDSCCPTYICDHPREPVLPQSDNQMSGTETPLPTPTIECRGDQCELSEPTKPSAESPEICSSGDCSPKADDKHETSECGPNGCHDVINEPVDSHHDVQPGCTDGKCEPSESPIKPCEGDNCKDISKIPSTSVCDGENCKENKIPESQSVPCEGDSCQANAGCAGSGCDSNVSLPPQETSLDCTGDQPCRRKDASSTGEVPSKCEGNDCVQTPDSSDDQNIHHLSTEASIPEQTLEDATETTKPVEGIKISVPIDEQKPIETTPASQSVAEKDLVTTEHSIYETDAKTDTLSENTSETQPIVPEDSSSPTVDKTDLPVTTESIQSEMPTDKETAQKPTVTDEMSTTSPDKKDQEGETIEPNLVNEEHTGKPSLDGVQDTMAPDFEDEHTTKPVSGDEYTHEPILDEEKITKVPDFIEKSTDKPDLSEDEVTKIPEIKLEHTETSDSEKVTKRPDFEGEYTDEPELDTQTDSKTSDILDDHTITPVLADKEVSKEPGIEVEHTEKPELEEEVTKVDDIMKEVYTDKPMYDDKEATKLPDITKEHTDISVQGEEEVTKSPEVVVEYTDKPALGEEDYKKPEEEHEPTVDTATKVPEDLEKSTDKPAQGEDDNTEHLHGAEKTTDKPDISEEEFTKTSDIDQGHTDKPVFTGESTEEPDVEKENDDKLDMGIEEGTKVPEIMEEYTNKPTSSEEEITKMPDVMKDTADQTTMDTEDGTKPPASQEKYTEKPATEDVTESKVPETEKEHTDKPIFSEEEGITTPGLVQEHTEKSTVGEEESTNIPEKEPSATKPTKVKEPGDETSFGDEEVTKVPDKLDEPTYKPATGTQEATSEPEQLEEEHTKKSDTMEDFTEGPHDDITEKTISSTDDMKVKPILVEEDLPEKPTDEEIADKTPSPFENVPVSEGEGTENPEILIDHETKKPELTDEGTVPPVVSEYTTMKPISGADEGGDQISMIEKETERPELDHKDEPETQTNIPAKTEEQEHIPQIPGEEGSGTESPDMHEPEPEKDIPSPEKDDIGVTVTESENTTKAPYEAHTVPSEDHTKSDSVPTDVGQPEVSSESSDVTSSESPISEPHDSVSLVTNIYDITTEQIVEQAATTKTPGSETSLEETSPPLREEEHETPVAHEDTKTPESVSSTESIMKPADIESITEQEEIYTEQVPEQELTATKSPALVMIEPQEGVQPESEVTAAPAMEEESSTKVFVDDVQPTPESHVSEAKPLYEITSAQPESETHSVTEISEVTEKETQRTELHGGEVTTTQGPISKETIKTEPFDEFTPEKEELMTSTVSSSITEPVKGHTVIEDSSVTGQGEAQTPDISVNIDESSEKPLESDTMAPEKPVESFTEAHEDYTEASVATETKPDAYIPHEPSVTKMPEQETQTESDSASVTEEQMHETSDEDKKTDVSVTELPVSIVTESQDGTTMSDGEEIEDTRRKIPPATTEHVTEEAEHATTAVPSLDTEDQKTDMKPEKPVETDVSQPTLTSDVTGKPDDSATLPEGPKSSSELPTTMEEAQTELPPSKVSTEASLSLVTEHKDDVNIVEESATEKLDTEKPEPETPIESHEPVTEPEGETASLPEASTMRPIEDATKPVAETSPQPEFSETTPYLIELEEHTHKIAEDASTISSIEDEEHTYKGVEEKPTPSTSEEDHTDKVEQDIITATPASEQEPTIKADEHSSTASYPVEGYTYKVPEDTSAVSLIAEEVTTPRIVGGDQDEEIKTEKIPAGETEMATKHSETTSNVSNESATISSPVYQPTSPAAEEVTEKLSETPDSTQGEMDQKDISTSKPQGSEETTTSGPTEKVPVSESDITVPTEKESLSTEMPSHIDVASHKTTVPEDELITTTKPTTTVKQEEIVTPVSEDKYDKPEEKPSSEGLSPTTTAEVPKPPSESHPTDELPTTDEDGHFPPSGTGYGEPDYIDEDQAFGPGTCRYGGKVYVSAQQIPRDDPCDFCFCFRSDIICLQQSCPPPIHGCHEEPIQGFCCPRYECPVSMATTVNVTTTTTTTTTTLPPHFPTHSYKGAAQRRGCQIKGHTYKVGEVVRSSSGPCLHCTCGGDGQMKCDPKACTPEPMLRQMIAAAVSAKRRR